MNILGQQISEFRRDRHIHIERKTRPKVHNFEICRPDVAGEERGDAVCHLVYHGPGAPPVCLDSISAFAHVYLLFIGLLIRHLHGDERRFVRLKDFRRDIITRPAGDTAILWRYNARAGNERCGGTKINELDMCGAVEHKIVGFHITFEWFREHGLQAAGVKEGTCRCTKPCEWHHATALITCGSHQRRSTSRIRSKGVDSRTSQRVPPSA